MNEIYIKIEERGNGRQSILDRAVREKCTRNEELFYEIYKGDVEMDQGDNRLKCIKN